MNVKIWKAIYRRLLHYFLFMFLIVTGCHSSSPIISPSHNGQEKENYILEDDPMNDHSLDNSNDEIADLVSFNSDPSSGKANAISFSTKGTSNPEAEADAGCSVESLCRIRVRQASDLDRSYLTYVMISSTSNGITKLYIEWYGYGSYDILWNGKDHKGEDVPDGTYDVELFIPRGKYKVHNLRVKAGGPQKPAWIDSPGKFEPIQTPPPLPNAGSDSEEEGPINKQSISLSKAYKIHIAVTHCSVNDDPILKLFPIKEVLFSNTAHLNPLTAKYRVIHLKGSAAYPILKYKTIYVQKAGKYTIKALGHSSSDWEEVEVNEFKKEANIRTYAYRKLYWPPQTAFPTGQKYSSIIERVRVRKGKFSPDANSIANFAGSLFEKYHLLQPFGRPEATGLTFTDFTCHWYYDKDSHLLFP